MDTVDVIVAGAGVLGLAIGRAFAMAGHQVVVVESEAEFGSGTSSRNSEVIHAGLYYPEGSLKAATCVAGRHSLYEYVRSRKVAHRQCGKFIVATQDEQVATLNQIKARAEHAGVDDLEWRTGAEVATAEPAVSCVAALWSPSTGIIDSHGYMQALLADLEDHDGMLVTRTPVERVTCLAGGGFEVAVGGAETYRIGCRIFINSAGLGAQALARNIEGLEPACVPPLYYSRGAYFVMSKRDVFSRLIYPVPEPGGLGVHVTLDLAGQARFGPDVEWIASENYDLDPRRADVFYAAVRKYYRGLQDGALQPGYTGIRPKLKAKGEGDADFVISGAADHKVEGLVNLFGIESPGLTASPALADRVLSAVG